MLIYKVDNIVDLDAKEVESNLKSIINHRFDNNTKCSVELLESKCQDDGNYHYFLSIDCEFDEPSVSAEELSSDKLNKLILLVFKDQYELSVIRKLTSE